MRATTLDHFLEALRYLKDDDLDKLPGKIGEAIRDHREEIRRRVELSTQRWNESTAVLARLCERNEKGYNKALEIYRDAGFFDQHDEVEYLMDPEEMLKSCPPFEEVQKALLERPELAEKINQGFGRILPVPFGLPIMAYEKNLSELLRRKRESFSTRNFGKPDINFPNPGIRISLRDVAVGPFFTLDGNPLLPKGYTLPPDFDNPNQAVDTSGVMFYEPTFALDGHGGRTKQEILDADQYPGWMVLLLEDASNIATVEDDKKGGHRRPGSHFGDRKHLLEQLGSDERLHEQGLTPEAWMCLFLTHLMDNSSTHPVIDIYGQRRNKGAACICAGAYIPNSKDIPCCYVSEGPDNGEGVHHSMVIVSAHTPKLINNNSRISSRTCVRVL